MLTVLIMNPLDAMCDEPRPDAVCVNNLQSAKPVESDVLTKDPDISIFLPFRFHVYKPTELFKPNSYHNYLVAFDGDHLVSLIDEISYTGPTAPLLSQYYDNDPNSFCNGDNRPANCDKSVDCKCVHKVDIPLNAVVEIVLIDEVQQPNISHPFHLHGYSYHVIGMGRSPDKTIKKISLKHALDLNRRGLLNRNFQSHPLKDNVAVPNNGYVVLRFKADNPGPWFFHCHFLYHIPIGMNLILQVGEPSDFPPVPPNFPTCGNWLPPISSF
ncbi:hypothetical protein PVAND_000768 [Polypedilum vanderplanki]|uniref:Plastocyanin-like domain-containing protein n=1 Tax=Polypedilum vanderplanki TaxID=319348 RepID=A0A9J6BL67_POLVA|nr:hypothetical protein PVAND_000768 [Polypedilum vanderplanki]